MDIDVDMDMDIDVDRDMDITSFRQIKKACNSAELALGPSNKKVK
jgi:hypothetical protein